MKTINNNRWDTLPKQIIYIIWEYHYIPFLQDIKTHKLFHYRYWCIGFNSNTMSIYEYLDHKISRELCKSLYGDVFIKYKDKLYFPERQYVIKLMKINKLRIRDGMKTRTMIHQLIKV